MSVPGVRMVTVDAWRTTTWAGGASHEIARWPDGDDWRARISVADIEQSGPFTRFPDCQRWLVVLDDGGGLVLSIDGVARQLGTGDVASFLGDGDVSATIIGRARVWNLIVRAGVSWDARVVDSIVRVTYDAGVVLVHALTEPVSADLGGARFEIEASATAIASGRVAVPVRVAGSPTASAVLVRLGIEAVRDRDAQLVIRLDGAALTTWDDVHDALARGFGFPGFYGRNLDALIDCLSYLDDASAGMSAFHVVPGSVAVIEIQHVDRIPSAIVAALTDTIALVNYRRRERGDGAIVTLSYARS